jgi:hypothetical protein
VEGNSHGLIYGTNITLIWRGWTKTRKTSVRIPNLAAEIRNYEARYKQWWALGLMEIIWQLLVPNIENGPYAAMNDFQISLFLT